MTLRGLHFVKATQETKAKKKTQIDKFSHPSHLNSNRCGAAQANSLQPAF